MSHVLINLNENRQYHGPAFGLLEKEEADLVPYLVFKKGKIRLLVSALAFNDKFNSFSDLRQKLLVFFKVDKSSGNNIWTAPHCAGFGMYQNDYHEHSVFG